MKLKETLKEFREFAVRGNVLDLAVGVVIGGAFGKIVSSLVSDIILPPIGFLLGKFDFPNLFINLSGGSYDTLAKAKAAGVATINYGLFINTIIEFFIVAFCIFFVVKQVNHFRESTPPPPPKTKECPRCFSNIPTRATKCPNCTADI